MTIFCGKCEQKCKDMDLVCPRCGNDLSQIGKVADDVDERRALALAAWESKQAEGDNGKHKWSLRRSYKSEKSNPAPPTRESVEFDPVSAERWWRRLAIGLPRFVSLSMIVIGIIVWIVNVADATAKFKPNNKTDIYAAMGLYVALVGMFLFVLIAILNTLGRICDLLTDQKKSS